MAGGGGLIGGFFNWLGSLCGGSTKPGSGFKFLSDAEYGVKFGANGGSSNAPLTVPGGGSMAPAGSGMLKEVDQVNLIRYLHPPVALKNPIGAP